MRVRGHVGDDMPLPGTTYEASVERLINASPEAVFDAFMDETAQAEWFADPGLTEVSITVEPRTGGRWDCSFQTESGRYYWTGVFLEVDRPRRFVAEFTTVPPDEDPFISTMTVTCEARGAQTFITVTEVHASERRRDEARGGIPGMLDVIQRFAEEASAR